MKTTLPVVLMACTVILLPVSGRAQAPKPTATNYSQHEEESKDRYNALQDSLTKYAEARDEAGLRFLNAHLDAQLKLEDYLIKSREAEHANVMVFGPIYVAALSAGVSLAVALLTTLVTNWVARRRC